MEGYTMANKKRSIAKKMGLKMNGKDSGYGHGMKYEGNGGKPVHNGGQKPKMNGKGVGKLAQKPVMSEKHPMVGNSIYTQNGRRA